MAPTAENVTPFPSHRSARGAFVGDALRSRRWSIRAAALAIGTNHTTLGSRVRGETAFQAEELEAIAHLLDRDPVDFYREYLSVPRGGDGNSPQPAVTDR